ncbi:MAG TPA: hypothetical protein VGE97_07540 [Nitrososphaera sp.]|jgi:hypothetical protein
MSQFDDELDLDQIDSLLAIPQGRTRGERTKNVERNVKTWFKVPHVKSSCQVAAHDESRPRDKGMMTLINDVAVCRICYLTELDRTQ